MSKVGYIYIYRACFFFGFPNRGVPTTVGVVGSPHPNLAVWLQGERRNPVPTANWRSVLGIASKAADLSILAGGFFFEKWILFVWVENFVD